jgi:hypothetical protein
MRQDAASAGYRQACRKLEPARQGAALWRLGTGSIRLVSGWGDAVKRLVDLDQDGVVLLSAGCVRDGVCGTPLLAKVPNLGCLAALASIRP